MTGGLQVVLVAMLAAAGGESAGREQARKAAVAADLGQYDRAAHLYEKAYEDHQDPTLLYRLAECLRLSGKTERARDVYRSYLKAAGPGAPDRAAAEARLAELEGQRPARVAPAPDTSPKPSPGPAPIPARARDGLGRFRASTVRVFAVARPTCEPFGYSSRCFPLLAHGSGLLFRSGGNVFVLTNKHVARAGDNDDGDGKEKSTARRAAGATETTLAVQVPNDARYFPARPVYEHPTQDVAVLRLLASPADLTALGEVAVAPEIASITPGEGLTVIGYPKEAAQDDPTSLEGTCSGVWKGFEKDTPITLTRTSAPVNEGESGGPAINARGQLVGMVVARIGAAQGLGLLIPSAALQETMSDLRRVPLPAEARAEPAYAAIAAAGGALNKYIEYFFQHQNMAAAEKQAAVARHLLETALVANPGATDAHLLMAWLDWTRVRLHAERMTKDDRISDEDFKRTVRADYRAACPEIVGQLRQARLEENDRRPDGIGAMLSGECRLLASGDGSLNRGQPWYAPVPTVGLSSAPEAEASNVVETEEASGPQDHLHQRGAGVTVWGTLAIAQQTSSQSTTSGQAAIRFGGTHQRQLEVGYFRQPLYPMAPQWTIAHAYAAGAWNGFEAGLAALGDGGFDLRAGQMVGPLEYGVRVGSAHAAGLCDTTTSTGSLSLLGLDLAGHVPFDERAELTVGASLLLVPSETCAVHPSLLDVGASFTGWLAHWLGGSVHASYLRLFGAPPGPVNPGLWGGATSIGANAVSLGVGARLPLGPAALLADYDVVIYAPAVQTVRLGLELAFDSPRRNAGYSPPAATWPRP